MWDNSCDIGSPGREAPRRSWRQRQEAEEVAGRQGLVQWQTNVYYCAGRVVVPALMDTFTIQAFAKRVGGRLGWVAGGFAVRLTGRAHGRAAGWSCRSSEG